MIAIAFTSPAVSEEKLKDPRMTTVNNPYAERDAESYATRQLMECNRARLLADAERRRGVHGEVYSGIMGMRYPS